MEPERAIFRKEALARYLAKDLHPEPLRVSPPWTWFLFWVVAAATAMALAVAVFGEVELQRPGRGILRPVSGVRLLKAEVAGTLEGMAFQSGDAVQAGQAIAYIRAAQVQGTLLELDRNLAHLRAAGRNFTEAEDQLMANQLASLRGRMVNQEAQVVSHERSVAVQALKVEASEKLLGAGLVSSLGKAEVQDGLNVALRQRDLARQQLAQFSQELAGLEIMRKRQAYQHTGAMQGAKDRRDALEATLRQTEIRAPVSGVLEALVARPGDLIQAGQPVAKLMPAEAALHVVAFLAEKDRPSVKVGDPVGLELDAYPFQSFGALRGRIHRLGADLASPYEIREALGEEAKLATPAYRVEIELLPARPRGLAQVTLRPGMLLRTRFMLGKQRIITVILGPVRRWLA